MALSSSGRREWWENQPRASQKQTRIGSEVRPPTHITKGADGRDEHTHTHACPPRLKAPSERGPRLGSHSLPAEPLKDTDGARVVHLSAGGLCRAGAAYLGAP